MASKKAGRLAGLSALAGLAYMNKDKFGPKDKTSDTVKSESKSESKSRDTDTGVDAMASDAAKKPAVDLGEIRDEEGRLSTLRRNTETGEMYDPIGSSSGKSAAAKVATQPKASSAPVTKIPEGAFRGMRSDSKAAKEAEQAKLMSPYKPMRPDVKLRDTQFVSGVGPREEFSNAQLREFGADERKESDADRYGKKRGGKVKKMASGGSASSRADGIATKGKTRGRMY